MQFPAARAPYHRAGRGQRRGQVHADEHRRRAAAATSGEILVAGRRVDARRKTRPAGTAHRVAILAQDKPLYRNFTVADMLTFGRRTNLVWDRRRALSWLERFDVPLGRRCGRLSGGQRAQVALAVALGACPGVLLLDEPLANLDPVARSGSPAS